jgi:hypothetical protein
LHENLGLDETLAIWSVETWAISLGMSALPPTAGEPSPAVAPTTPLARQTDAGALAGADRETVLVAEIARAEQQPRDAEATTQSRPGGFLGGLSSVAQMLDRQHGEANDEEGVVRQNLAPLQERLRRERLGVSEQPAVAPRAVPSVTPAKEVPPPQETVTIGNAGAMEVQVSARKVTFPMQCLCCSRSPDTQVAFVASRTTGKRVVRTETRSCEIPVCKRCLTHNSARVGSVRAARAMTVVGIGAMPFGYGQIVWLVVGVALVAGQFWARWRGMKTVRSFQSDSCTCDSFESTRYLGWRGSVHYFEFGSQRYALAFMRANRSKLVNLRVESVRLLESDG